MVVDEFVIYKLKTVPTDLSKLSDIVDKDVVKKTVYDESFQNVNAIDSYKQNLKKKDWGCG